MTGNAIRHAALVLLLNVIVILSSNEVFVRTRGALSPEEMTSRYLEAVRHGDGAAVAWLMQDGRVDEATIRSRIAVYRTLPSGTTLLVEPTQHSEASYIKGARISAGSSVIDEIGMQHHGGRFGSRWRLFFPAAAARR